MRLEGRKEGTMREFAYGTDRQYELLEEELEDRMCHVYRCTLPSGCSPSNARIGFEKEGSTYALFIDRGIAYTGNHDGFKEWIQKSVLRFLDFADMAEFLKTMKTMF